MSMDTLREEVLSILNAVGITLRYGEVESKPGELAEGKY